MHKQRAHSHQRGKCADKCGLAHAHISGKLHKTCSWLFAKCSFIFQSTKHTGVLIYIFLIIYSDTCPASFCHQKAPSVKQRRTSCLPEEVLRTVDQVQPRFPSTVFKDKDGTRAATTFFIHALIQASIKMFQGDVLIPHPATSLP